MSDPPKLQRNEIWGQYLVADPVLVNKQKHGLTLTSDGKLRVDDPTTQAKIDEALAILESAAHGNAALKLLIDALQADLDNPDQYKADVAALALEVTLTAIKGGGWTDETLVTLKAWQDARDAERGTDGALLAASYVTERGTDLAELEIAALTRYNALTTLINALEAERGTDDAMLAVNGALEATLTAIKGGGWTTETLKAIYDFIEINHNLLGTVATEVEAIEVKLDTPANFKADVSDLMLAASYVTERGTNLSQLESSALTRYNALTAAINAITGGASAADVWAYGTRRLTNLSDARAAYIDHISDYTLGDVTLYLSEIVNCASDDEWRKQLEVIIGGLSPTPSTIRISFDIKSSSASYRQDGKIYRNGGAVGTVRSTTSTSYVTFVEDETFADSDALQIYGKEYTYGTCCLRFLRIKGSLSLYSKVMLTGLSVGVTV